MSPVTGMGPTCCVKACMAPVRFHGNYCARHYYGLSAAQRAALEWEDAQPTEPIDTEAIAECVALEALLAIEWADDAHPREEAA